LYTNTKPIFIYVFSKLIFDCMEIFLITFLVVTVSALIMEYIDSSLGMGYGTVLSPFLILMGFEPLLVVPSILISQAAGGLSASFFHHKFKNVEYKWKSRDSNIVCIITISGIMATVIAAIIAISIPKYFLNIYIGILVCVMGIILASNVVFRFKWSRIIGVGLISAFNKGMSGGGFGPVVTGGQIISGQNHKNAIGCTTMAEVPICLTGFLIYLAFNGISNWLFVLALLIGAIIAAPFGAFTTSKLNSIKFRRLLGLLITLLGIWTIWKVFS